MAIAIPYLNAKALDEPDIYKAVYEFIEQYGVPAMADAPETGRIFRGWANRAVLPSDNEYAVMTILNHTRRGTTIESFDATDKAWDEDGDNTAYELIECEVQIDFCSDASSGNARRRAQAIETVARSSIGPAFFADYNIGCLYATAARDLSFVGDASQYVSRWMTTLRLTYVTAVSAELPWFDRVNVWLENVDVDHKPTED